MGTFARLLVVVPERQGVTRGGRLAEEDTGVKDPTQTVE